MIISKIKRMATELVSEIESVISENNQRAILARWKTNQPKYTDVLYELSRLVVLYPEIYNEAYYHCHYYNRILSLEEEEQVAIMTYFTIKYPNPNWKYATKVLRGETEETDVCTSEGCERETDKRGLCMVCRSREPEEVILAEYEMKIAEAIEFM